MRQPDQVGQRQIFDGGARRKSPAASLPPGASGGESVVALDTDPLRRPARGLRLGVSFSRPLAGHLARIARFCADFAAAHELLGNGSFGKIAKTEVCMRRMRALADGRVWLTVLGCMMAAGCSSSHGLSAARKDGGELDATHDSGGQGETSAVQGDAEGRDVQGSSGGTIGSGGSSGGGAGSGFDVAPNAAGGMIGSGGGLGGGAGSDSGVTPNMGGGTQGSGGVGGTGSVPAGSGGNNGSGGATGTADSGTTGGSAGTAGFGGGLGGSVSGNDAASGDAMVCGAICDLYCPSGYALDSAGCPTCACKPAPECPKLTCTTYCSKGYVVDANGCQTCECLPGPVCPALTCTTYCANGFVADPNGCPTCECVADPNGNCSSYAESASCNADAGCKWLEPGCRTPALPMAGCYSTTLLKCTSDKDCPGNRTCLSRVADPCAGRVGCTESCSTAIQICL
jgi:hypothetical protein